LCGIAGLIHYRGAASDRLAADLLRVRDHMTRRGPDGAGLWWSDDRQVGLAHRRLAIIDLDDRALQPMHAGPFSIVFNGEIYNYQALREGLIRNHGFQPRTTSDTEVILALFAAHGAEMLDMLRGMFTIAIWDKQRRRLFVARDPYGIKPLYYADEGGAFRFASQVKALRQFSDLSADPDPAGMVGFQLFGSIPEPFTLHRAIRALPAGSYLWVDEKGAGEPLRYAKVADVLADAEPDNGVDGRALIAAAVRDSVAAHLVADVEVGAFLSSGIDSGSIVGLMRDCGQERIRAITLGFEELAGTASDEVPLARAVARQYGAEHHVRPVSGDEFRACAEQILADMDQPSVDGVNTWFVSKAAHECGLKVVVSGLGGDELLAGYSTFRTVPRTRHYGGRAALIPFAARFARFAMERFVPAWSRANPKAVALLEHAGTWAGSYLLRRAVMLPFEIERRLDADTVREGMERLQPLALIDDAITPMPEDDLAIVSALESSLYMRNQLLRDSDWASMAHSLELRVPLVDWPTLAKIAPITHRLAAGGGKRALAHAPSRPLPAKCLTRGRTGFTIPVAKWIGAAQSPTARAGSRHWSAEVNSAFGLAA
jgi:asparagine synthase (glutamine-hydrolysing)